MIVDIVDGNVQGEELRLTIIAGDELENERAFLTRTDALRAPLISIDRLRQD